MEPATAASSSTWAATATSTRPPTRWPRVSRWAVSPHRISLGEKLPRSPEWTGTLGFDYHLTNLLPNPSGLPFNPLIPGSFDNAVCFGEPGRELWVRFTRFF